MVTVYCSVQTQTQHVAKWLTDTQYTGFGDIKAAIKAIYCDNAFVKTVSSDETTNVFGIILDKTNFYGESGGQQYDTGSLMIDDKAEFAVDDCQIFGGYVLHIGYLKYGSLSVGDEIVASYDEVSGDCSTAAAYVTFENVAVSQS